MDSISRRRNLRGSRNTCRLLRARQETATAHKNDLPGLRSAHTFPAIAGCVQYPDEKLTKKGESVVNVNHRVRNSSFAVVIGCAAAWSVGVASAQEAIAPTATLDVATATIVNAQPNYVMEQPAPPREIPFLPTMSRTAYDAAKARAANSSVPGTVKPFTATTFPLAVPAIKVTNFNAHGSTEGLRPPDTHGAIGPAHFVEVTNSHIDMFTRLNVPQLPLAKSVTLATFFGYTAETLFDPRVVYDSTWDRWIVTAEAFPESTTVQRYFIAVSTSGDPTSTFFIYSLDIDIFNNNDLWDFPQLGIDQDAVLFTANIFADGGNGGFLGADFFAAAKARLYNGLGFSVPIFTGLVGTLAPPIVFDQNASTFLIAAEPSGTTFTKYTATNTSHPGSTALVASTITVPSYTVPPAAHQFGTTDRLDTSDARFVNASSQNGDDLWQTHTIALGAFPAPRFYRLNTASNSVTQSGFYFASGSSDDFNASIVANTSGDCFVTWTSTDAGAGINAQIRLSGKLNADAGIAAGTAGFTSVTFYDASGDTTERWGDYSAISADPLNTNNAWLVNEKVNTVGFLWGSRIMKIGY
jgi:hypothetical protein